MNDRKPMARLMIVVVCASLALGCAKRDPNWKETVPVKGTLTVDGKAEEGVMVRLTSVDLVATGGSAADPLPAKGATDATGAFAVTTYELGDGAPPGEYVVTYDWPTLNMLSMQQEGDRLNGRYKDEKAAEKRIKVESGKPLDLGKIELTTK